MSIPAHVRSTSRDACDTTGKRKPVRWLLTVVLLLSLISIASAREQKDRNIFICISKDASPAIKAAAQDLLANAKNVPALRGLQTTQEAGPAVLKTSEDLLHKKKFKTAAFNHLVVIGLKSKDPLMEKCWDLYLSMDEAKQQVYTQGFGHLKGELGYIESDRNPFLHSGWIKKASFTTSLFKLSGTTERGVLAAVAEFKKGMLNGIVPVGKLTRPKTTILDLDPSVAPCLLQLPQSVPVAENKQAPYVGWHQLPANEYRTYIDQAGFEPVHVWRIKYLVPGAFKGQGALPWLAGFHRMAFGNAVNVVQFKDAAAAAKTAAAIARHRGWAKDKKVGAIQLWSANQPTDEAIKESPGKIYVASHRNYVIMSSLGWTATEAVVRELK